jgi:hypothetical protein
MVLSVPRDPEDYPYCLDCWKRDDPATENDRPAKQFGYDTREEAFTHAENIVKAGHYRYLVLYDGTGSSWEPIAEWD